MPASAQRPLLIPGQDYARCGGCGDSLPLRPPNKATKQVWVCVACGAQFRAEFAREASHELQSRVRIAIDQVGPPVAESRLDRRESRPPAAAPPETLRRAATPDRVVSTEASTAISRALDSVSGNQRALRVMTRGKPFAASITPRGATPYDPEVEAHTAEQHRASIAQMDLLVESIERGGDVDPGETEAVARDTLVQAASDLDLFLKLGVNPIDEGYPGRHSLHVAMVATGIGAQLGWDQQTIVETGVGCLIHDLGMTQVPDREYQRSVTLDDLAMSRIAAHPLHTFDLIEEHLSSVPLPTRMVAYQIHEREDGTGYPRRRNATLIHEASKVAAVADVFVALVSPRPHRPAMMPYYAVEHIVRAAGAGRFDPNAVRALLKAVSLFPIGSCVELSEGRVGKVIRSNPGDYCRPVLEVWRSEELDAPPSLIDLAAERDTRVVRALPQLAA